MSLIPEHTANTDYILPSRQYCWITVGEYSLFIAHRKDSMNIEIYEAHEEFDSPLYEYTLPLQPDDSSTISDHEPINSDHEPINSDYEPINSDQD